MAKSIQLQVRSSCHQNWDQMAPVKNDRFCNSCQKEVVDFTQMSDEELVRFFNSHSGSLCGRFHKDQLNRDIIVSRKPFPWIKYFFKFSLPAFLLSLKSSAQAQKTSTLIESSPVKNVPSTPQPKTREITCVVLGNGKPLQFVTIAIQGTNQTIITNRKGQFTYNFTLPANIIVSRSGYEVKELAINASSDLGQINLERVPDYSMGDTMWVRRSEPFIKKEKRKTTPHRH